MTIDPITVADLPPRMAEGDPRAPLGFRSQLRPDLQAAEDATAASDFDRAHGAGPRFTRPSTEAERVLLTALGWTDWQGDPPAPGLMTEVQFAGGIRMRAWPDLTAPTITNTSTGSETP